MGLTFDEAARLGIAHLHPDGPGGGGASPGPRSPRHVGRRSPSKGLNSLGQNKTEASLSEHLSALYFDGAVWDFGFQRLKLRLAGRTWFTPDFDVWPRTGDPVFIDVKGHLEDDAAVKIKAAADKYPMVRFFLVSRSGRHGWSWRPVTSRGGIGKPVPDPFVEG